MEWTELHPRILGQSFEKVLGKPENGAMAFVRCLTPEVVRTLAKDPSFAPQGWQVFCVADSDNEEERTISADRAVEIRETKGDATLLLVDTERGGAGMDGIYSAGREVNEKSLFAGALRVAKGTVRNDLFSKYQPYAEHAVKKARGYGHRFSVSLWTEFDFLCRIAAAKSHPGAYLHLLGLWPVEESEGVEAKDELNDSRLFVDRLLGTEAGGLTPVRRIASLRLAHPSERQVNDLERFLHSTATKPLLDALAELRDKKHLWVGALKTEGSTRAIQSIALSPWRNTTGKIAKWSGLVEEGDPPPAFIMKPDAEQTGDYSKLEVRWKARPANLEKGAVDYHVVITTDMDEELAARDIAHSAGKEEKCRFDNDDFSTLSEDAYIPAKVVVSVLGNDSIEPEESEEFTIRFGSPPEHDLVGVGKKVRTFSEGLIELDDREMVSALASSTSDLPVDSKGFVLLRTPQRGKSFRVFRPPLIGEVEKQWSERKGELGRWRVKVRASGTRAGECEFVPFARPESAPARFRDLWNRAETASRKMAERFASGGGVGQVYDEKARAFDTVKDYLLAWAALLEESTPSLALAHTVEVQSLSGRTIGLIVLPSYPLRIAWQVAYDNLVLHAAFAQKTPPRDIRDEFAGLDGALFPAFLPGLRNGQSFVFADTLGFHAVGMVPDDDKEPKAAMAILARALGGSETADTAPTAGRQSATVLGNEIVKYLECHNALGPLQIHTLRAGDGATVARSLGRVHERYRSAPDDEDSDEDTQETTPAFVLELYPSQEQRGIAGRFIAEAREKRRRGAGVLSQDDSWMLESLSFPGGVNLPKLRWARKSGQDPKTAAHLAVAFDTFESRVMPQGPLPGHRSLYAFGLLSFFERAYASTPSPLWHSAIPASKDGEKHPSDRAHTDRLMRLQQALQKAVTRNIGSPAQSPVLTTEISPDKADSLRDLHRRCDWVITLDRNAGIEYFDSPRDNKDIYDAYVIDCVPEREDLGCLQLITSTSNLREIRSLLDEALDQMGLSRSRRNAAFLMEHLKALSGRLAIRLTGQKAPTSELIALAVCHANCSQTSGHDNCWVSLQHGFIIPVDDVRDLLPPLNRQAGNEEEKESRPDLIYVSMAPRKGLRFQFIEVKYRRHLRAARTPELLDSIRRQVESLRKRWDDWYGHEGDCASFRAIRRAKLARVLRFYADKAHRHALSNDRHEAIVSEIDRMIEKGGDYTFAEVGVSDCGWVFCPEYTGHHPLEISPTGWNMRIFLVGSGLLSDADFRRNSVARPSDDSEQGMGGPSVSPEHEDQGPGGGLDVTVRVASAPGDTSAGKLERSDETPSVCLGTDIFTNAEVRWPLTVQGNPHLLVAGLPGMGKTTCLLNLCKQMVAAGIRPIVFSYHQDIDERLERLVGSVRFIDFHGLGFNPLQVLERESRMAYLDVAGALRDIFMAIFPELGDIQGERIRKAIKDSFDEAGWDDPDTVPADRREPEFKRFMEILRSDPKPDRGLHTLLARLEELEDYGFFDIQESHESLWESERPVVIRIHPTQNDNLQRAFASLVFYSLYKDMFRRGIQERITHAVIFDEAHRASRLNLIPTMAKECRKYGVSLVLASQEAKDFNTSLFSAIANYLVLRLTGTDAKALVRNVASSQLERSLIDKIKQMDSFKALYFCEGKSRPSPVGLLP